MSDLSAAGEIRRLIEYRVNAIRDRDVDRATECLDPEIVLFDVVDPLQYSGVKAVRVRSHAWFSSFAGPIGYEISNLEIAAGDDVAFSYSFNHVTAETRGGETIDMWWRSTACWQKNHGKWIVVHEHNSVPFDPATGKASVALRPGGVFRRL